MKRQPFEYTILVVDDSVETVELIKRNLEGVGYNVFAANHVQGAISILDSVEIDLAITDLKMPDQNGLQLIRHVTENFKGIGVLVITGFPSIQGAVESIKIGAEEYLVKPFTDEELFKAIERVLSKIKSPKKRNLPKL